MKLVASPLPGLVSIDLEKLEDARGFFARTVSSDMFADWGLRSDFIQSSVSYNESRGTLRGMHYQAMPHGETKLIRCTRGAIHDVVIDLRAGSETRGQWYAVELTEDNHRSLYVPEGFAHGFLTLRDRTEVLYQMTDRYVPQAASGVRWNDPAFGIDWPFAPTIMSDRDRTYPDFIA